MKRLMKRLVVAILGWQVRRLRKKASFKIVGVVGSIGKTSTKLAIAQTLGKNTRVRYQEGNYNDLVSVPLIFFGQDMPSLLNPLAWLGVFWRNHRQINKHFPYDVVVTELGTDGPGQIAAFKRYLELDLAVVTSVAPEHMEYFTDLAAVAAEELSVSSYAKQIIYNSDLVAAEFRQGLAADSVSYGITDSEADYHLSNIYHSVGGFEGDIKHHGEILLHVQHEVVSQAQLYSLLAAVVVAVQCGIKPVDVLHSLSAILPVSGRLRRLRGINNSTIIDDTYNASPDAVMAGLQTVYSLNAPQKIAVLGSMNELGPISQQAHRQVGELCDPQHLALLVTIGAAANEHLAPAAIARGCTVKSFDNPYAAGEYVQSKIEPGAIIFAKGSQNGVFAEEAVKQLLADPEDAAKLVRQSPDWLKRKKKAFSGSTQPAQSG